MPANPQQRLRRAVERYMSLLESGGPGEGGPADTLDARYIEMSKALDAESGK